MIDITITFLLEGKYKVLLKVLFLAHSLYIYWFTASSKYYVLCG